MLWARFQEYNGEGLSGRAAAAGLEVLEATGVRCLWMFREQGNIMRDDQGWPKVREKLTSLIVF